MAQYPMYKIRQLVWLKHIQIGHFIHSMRLLQLGKLCPENTEQKLETRLLGNDSAYTLSRYELEPCLDYNLI